MSTIRKLTNQFIYPLIDFVYPPICISCNKSLTDGRQKVCNECWSSMPVITKIHPLYQETNFKLLDEGNISELVSCFVFEQGGPFQHITHALKYNEYKSFGIELGKRMGIVIKEWNIETDLIIPIPLHRVKYRERGYNQSEFIARGISSILNKPVETKAVYRVRHTQSQTKLNHEQRRQNMEGAFKTDPQAQKILSGKNCLLVDDIITTGATTNSCAKELLSAGAAKIFAASAALAK